MHTRLPDITQTGVKDCITTIMADSDHNSDHGDECRACSLLLETPPEIRNSIIGPLVTYSEPLPVTHSTEYDNTTFYEPPIPKVCKQLRDETLPVLYGVNTFEIRRPVKNRYNSKARLVDGPDDVTKHVHNLLVYPNYPSKRLSFAVNGRHSTKAVAVTSKYSGLLEKHTCTRDFTPIAEDFFEDEYAGLQDQPNLFEVVDKLQHAENGRWPNDKLRCGETPACGKTKRLGFVKSDAADKENVPPEFEYEGYFSG